MMSLNPRVAYGVSFDRDIDQRPRKRRRLAEESDDGESSGGDADIQPTKTQRRLKNAFESIFERYGHDFSGVGDEVDLESGRIVVDNGHINAMDEASENDHWLSLDSLARVHRSVGSTKKVFGGSGVGVGVGPRKWVQNGRTLHLSLAEKKLCAILSAQGVHISDISERFLDRHKQTMYWYTRSLRMRNPLQLIALEAFAHRVTDDNNTTVYPDEDSDARARKLHQPIPALTPQREAHASCRWTYAEDARLLRLRHIKFRYAEIAVHFKDKYPQDIRARYLYLKVQHPAFATEVANLANDPDADFSTRASKIFATQLAKDLLHLHSSPRAVAWSEDDEKLILIMVREGMSFDAMSPVLNCSAASIAALFEEMKLDKPRLSAVAVSKTPKTTFRSSKQTSAAKQIQRRYRKSDPGLDSAPVSVRRSGRARRSLPVQTITLDGNDGEFRIYGKEFQESEQTQPFTASANSPNPISDDEEQLGDEDVALPPVLSPNTREVVTETKSTHRSRSSRLLPVPDSEHETSMSALPSSFEAKLNDMVHENNRTRYRTDIYVPSETARNRLAPEAHEDLNDEVLHDCEDDFEDDTLQIQLPSVDEMHSHPLEQDSADEADTPVGMQELPTIGTPKPRKKRRRKRGMRFSKLFVKKRKTQTPSQQQTADVKTPRSRSQRQPSPLIRANVSEPARRVARHAKFHEPAGIQSDDEPSSDDALVGTPSYMKPMAYTANGRPKRQLFSSSLDSATVRRLLSD